MDSEWILACCDGNCGCLIKMKKKKTYDHYWTCGMSIYCSEKCRLSTYNKE